MTAEIAVMNKKAVALAADSAVTNQDGKIFNSANKLFMLSRHFPIGIMIYNNAEFMGYQWEAIIKNFRKQLKHKSFDTVKEYAIEFLKYLEEKTDFYNRDEDFDKLEKRHVENSIANVLSIIQDEFKNTALSQNTDNWASHLANISKKYLVLYDNAKNVDNIDQEFIDNFKIKYEQTLVSLIKSFFPNEELLKEAQPVMLELSFIMLFKKWIVPNYTGLVISGFGEKEQFPSLHAINVSLKINGKLIHYFRNDYTITHNHYGFILPFAQGDVVDNLISGIEPALKKEFFDQAIGLVNTLDGSISTLREQSSIGVTVEQQKQLKEALMSAIQNSRGYIEKYAFEKITIPLLKGVNSADMNELASMAETLINLTSFKLKFSSNQAESVGGPIDVAVISKGDGFVWVKRKHYFSREYNEHYFSNVYSGNGGSSDE